MFKLSLSLALVAIATAKKYGSTFNGTSYISQTRQQKSDMIWSEVTENTKSSGWHLAGMLIVDENPVFDTPGDELECKWNGCRNKTIHAQGSVAKVQWKSVGDHPYTGIFKGADTGFTRWGSANPQNVDSPSMTPGMGVKFLRDGVDSGNFVAMWSVDGQKSMNWFANDFFTHIADAKSPLFMPLEKRFATATDYITDIGMSDMAKYDQDGNEEAEVVFPWYLHFKPTGEFMFPDTKEEGAVEWQDSLATIPSGSVLYDIYAWSAPPELGGTESMIG
jgi:hypothetical protein